MKKTKLSFLLLGALTLAALTLAMPLRAVDAQRSGEGGGGAPLKYPETKKVDVADTYFGTEVRDPYRWLEDDRSPEVAAWVEAQNKVTYAYLDQIPYRAAIKNRLMKLFNYPKYGAPTRRGRARAGRMRGPR